MPKRNAEYDSVIAEAQEDEEEVEGSGGDWPPVHDFKEYPELIGTYAGSETVKVNGEDRTVHNFVDTDSPLEDGKGVQSWGTMILDDKLTGREKLVLRVVFTGEKLGRAWNYKVFTKRQALHK